VKAGYRRQGLRVDLETFPRSTEFYTNLRLGKYYRASDLIGLTKLLAISSVLISVPPIVIYAVGDKRNSSPA
jgi:hypothetical protein